jgi:hypothetical protein
MSIGAAPNLGGGLWMSGMSDSSIGLGNGNANIGQNVDCEHKDRSRNRRRHVHDMGGQVRSDGPVG